MDETKDMDKKPDQTSWMNCGDMTAQDVRNIRRFRLGVGIWGVSFIGATFIIKKELLPAGPLPWLVATLPILVGLYVLVTYSRFLRQADELQRMIQLRALALGFGAGWLFAFGYPLFERLGAPHGDYGMVILVMAICYSVGILIGRRQYR